MAINSYACFMGSITSRGTFAAMRILAGVKWLSRDGGSSTIRTHVTLLLAALGILLVAPIASAQSDPVPPRAAHLTPRPPTPAVSWNARVLAPVVAKAQPNHRAKAVMTVQPVAPLGGGPTILLVLSHRVINGQEWTKLLLPIRPNGTSGWVPSDYLRFRKNNVRIVVDVSERRTYVYRNNRLVLRERNAVGASRTPTPFGHFAIAEKVLGPPRGFLGPVIMPATGYSNVLNEYAGGNGRFALHGTSVPDSIGRRASNGCVRHYNAAILRISRLVAPGTPLLIRP